jgi:hypothetical protein
MANLWLYDLESLEARNQDVETRDVAPSNGRSRAALGPVPSSASSTRIRRAHEEVVLDRARNESVFLAANEYLSARPNPSLAHVPSLRAGAFHGR